MPFKVQQNSVIYGASAPAGAARALPADDVDLAVAGLQNVTDFADGMVIDYVRAKNVQSLQAFTTRAGNQCTPTAGAVFDESDADFNGCATLDMSAMGTAGFPLSVACPASFTYIFSLHTTALKAVNHLLGVAGSRFAFYLTNLGQPVVDDYFGGGEAPYLFNDIAFPNAATHLGWISHDAISKTSRFGTSVSVRGAHVHAQAHAPDAGSFARPFSFYQAQAAAAPTGRTEGWLLLNHPYAATGSEPDVAIAALYQRWRQLLIA